MMLAVQEMVNTNILRSKVVKAGTIEALAYFVEHCEDIKTPFMQEFRSLTFLTIEGITHN